MEGLFPPGMYPTARALVHVSSTPVLLAMICCVVPWLEIVNSNLLASLSLPRQFTGTMPYMLEICVLITIYTHDWADMGIILFMLIANASLGFKEQLEAAHALAELTKKMEARINCLRDGGAEMLLTRELVPGDLVMLAGGVQVPADIEWVEGDVLGVDTAALTGEPIPRKYPGNYANPNILCGCTVVSGEAYGIVKFTGAKTEAGAGEADIAKDKSEVKVSVFERKVLLVVQIVVGVSCMMVVVILLVQGFMRHGWKTKKGFNDLLLSCLSIIVASIPIALPIVLQVTMALGAGKMARDFHAVVTSVPALQDISSMSVLCSDKTGTLTTAKITIIPDMTWTPPGFTKEDVALYAYMSANPDKKEDPIDRSVINHFKDVFGDRGPGMLTEYTKVRSVGFNPNYKRVVYEWTHPKLGTIIIGKGIISKVLWTGDGGVDDHEDQWKVQNYEELKETVTKKDYELSKAGYKTLGVSMKVGDKPWVFVGILAQMDPPRVDTEITINALRSAGIKVKMITGDHLNIAKETSRKIGLGTDKTKTKIPNIQPGSIVREHAGTMGLTQMVLDADGFAQVLPSDKREVVEVLRQADLVVGMTGDGVNDAPALSRAQCGVAVDDATDAAKNASAIILTSEGLSAIYAGVVESRRIFRKLKAYVTYRFAASIQIVSVLSFLVLVSNCSIEPLYIILLALLNDLTMLPIAYDYQQASKNPENPDVNKILFMSAALGLLETMFSLVFAYSAGRLHGSVFISNYDYRLCDPTALYTTTVPATKISGVTIPAYSVSVPVPTDVRLTVEAGIFIQMFIAAELLIFSTRAPTYFFKSSLPSAALAACVMAGCVLMSVLVVTSKDFGKIAFEDVVVIYGYNFLTFTIIDAVKVKILQFLGEQSEVLSDRDVIKEELAKLGVNPDAAHNGGADTGDHLALKSMNGAEKEDRMSIMGDRMTNWAIKHDDRYSQMSQGEARQSIADEKMRKSQIGPRPGAKQSAGNGHVDIEHRSVATARGMLDGQGSDRPSLLGQPIRPNTPANRYGVR